MVGHLIVNIWKALNQNIFRHRSPFNETASPPQSDRAFTHSIPRRTGYEDGDGAGASADLHLAQRTPQR